MSNSYKYDYVLFIGRFQGGCHIGHLAVIRHALALGQTVIIGIGSANVARSIKNPFTVEERKEMILLSLMPHERLRIKFIDIDDMTYNNNEWIIQVQKKVTSATISTWSDKPAKIALTGFKKDSSSQYLDWFPNLTFEEFSSKEWEGIDASHIRISLFSGKHFAYLYGVLPPGVITYLKTFKETRPDVWDMLEKEYEFITNYKKQWENAPYPPTFVTVDAIVSVKSHILMVERKALPGKGLLAIPGGFINQNETIAEATIRELKEETRIKVPESVLKGSIVTQKVFDDPSRSLRGRTITHATLFNLVNETKLPKVKGSDDAAEAFWIPFSELDPKLCYEDHWHIIKNIISNLN